MLRIAVRAPEQSRIACRAWFAARTVVDKVTSASVLSVVVPATAESNSDVIEVLTVSPQVPPSVPETGKAKPNNVVVLIVM